MSAIQSKRYQSDWQVAKESPHDVVNLLAELEQGVNLVGPLQLPVVARQLVDQLLALPD